MIAIVNVQDNKLLLVQRKGETEWTCPVTNVGSERDEAKLLHDFRIMLGMDMKIKERLGDFSQLHGKVQIRVISVFVVELMGVFNINYDRITAWKYASREECDTLEINPQIKSQVIPACVARGILMWESR